VLTLFVYQSHIKTPTYFKNKRVIKLFLRKTRTRKLPMNVYTSVTVVIKPIANLDNLKEKI